MKAPNRIHAPNQLPRLSVGSLAHKAEAPPLAEREDHWSYQKTAKVTAKLRKENRMLKLLGL